MQRFPNSNPLQNLYAQAQQHPQQAPQQWMQYPPQQSYQQHQAYMQNQQQQQWLNQQQRPATPPRFSQPDIQQPWQYQRPMTPPNYMMQQQQQRISTPTTAYFQQQQQFPQPRSATPPPYMQQEFQQQSPYSYNQWPEQPQQIRPKTAPVKLQEPSRAETQTPPKLVPEPSAIASTSAGPRQVHSTLTEPVWVTLKRDVNRVASNLTQIVVFGSTRGDPARTLRDWDLWGPFFFIIAMSCILSSTATDNNSTVFAVVFAVLSAGAVSLTMNVVLLGGKLNFFQSLSVLGYCLFPLDVGAIVCLASGSKIYRSFIVLATLLWCSWSVYPFVSTAVRPSRKALAVYPVFLMYISMGFLVLANG